MKKIKRIKNIIILGILIIISFLISLRSSASIMNKTSYITPDVAVWINVARLMSDGKVIYASIFDHKGPILYLVYFLGYNLFRGKLGIWVIELICSLIDSIMIFLISKKITKSSLKSVFVLSIAMLFLSFLCRENPCTESLVIPFVLISLYQFIKFINFEDTFGKKESLITGICLGIVLMIRPNLISLWIIFDLFIFVKLLTVKKFKELLSIILYSLLGVIVIFIPILIYLAANNAIMDFIKNYIIFNFKYSGIKEVTILQALSYFIRITRGILSYVLIFNIFLIGYYVHKKDKNKYTLMILNLIYFALTMLLIVMPQRLYDHYVIIMLPTILLPIAFVIKDIKINEFIIALLIILTFTYIGCDTKQYIDFLYANNDKTQYLEQISKYIENNTEENDNVLQIGIETNIYILSNRKYNGKYFYSMPICMYDKEIMNEFLKELMNDLPKVIADVRVFKSNEREHEFHIKVNKILEEYYTTENDVIYIKKENLNE